ncbi:hypothetical protein WJ60_16815 [Burkholderia ubonensis]|uniref:cell envelope integrity protein CreD n=1 Tax=Burkholderia ubonensis TaxID=101571 RepID=UPI00075DA5C5|nr:cell envelope integrity protein CreD [Burkholderia ubonensis]KVM63923.1 hypothetical protein WJ60_16815 [Burkholderia ubonensis]
MNRVLLFKSLITACLVLLILIPLHLVSGIVQERASYRDDALRSIWSSYAGPQTMTGPILVVPYTEVTRIRTEAAPGQPASERVQTEAKRLLVFPKTLSVKGGVATSVRYRGIHKALVYDLQSRWEGTLALPDLKQLQQSAGHVSFAIGNPYLAFGISDIRGLMAQPVLVFGGKRLTMEQGAQLPSLRQGVHADVDLGAFPAASSATSAENVVPFSIELPLLGAQSVAFAPIADQNDFSLKSAWPHPSFDGAFLPRTRTVDAGGFASAWSLTSFNTKVREQIAAGSGDEALFVMLTFASFFMFELVKRLRIHPIQYLLVGLSLALFFLLLLSLSEHIAFEYAYLAASGACIGLLGFYLSFVLHSVKRGAAFAGLLALLYAALYGLLLSEDNALMLGSLLLFAILAGIMTLTRRIDWYSVGAAWQPLADEPEAGAAKPDAPAQ